MMIESVYLYPGLAERVCRATQGTDETLESFVNEAIVEYLARLEDKKLANESAAYAQCYPQLKEKYFGQFVAVHNGEVVDVDPEFKTLFLRIQQALPGQVVLIRRVTDKVVPEYRIPKPRLARNLNVRL